LKTDILNILIFLRIHNPKNKYAKVGIIRCQQTEDMCSGISDFKVSAKGKLAFKDIGPVEVMGFVTCGGCPGKRAVARAKMMIDKGADVIAMASCIQKGNPIGFACPHFDTMRNAIKKSLPPEIQFLDWTH